jgi:hypothetical protein
MPSQAAGLRARVHSPRFDYGAGAGTGIVVGCVVVAGLVVSLSVSQPLSIKSAAAARQGIMNFFMRIILVSFVT